MGFRTFGFAFGRPDIWAPEDDIYWGPEDVWLDTQGDAATPAASTRTTASWSARSARSRWASSTSTPRARTACPTRSSPGQDIRETFGRMAMNDEETVALTVGGHTFGKMHGGASRPRSGRGRARGRRRSPSRASVGSNSEYGTGMGADTITSGLEGAWTPTPTQWDNKYLETLFESRVGAQVEVAGRQPTQWQPKEVKEGFMVPPVAAGAPETKPTMTTADMAMITDPAYLEISKRFHENPDQLADAFARAWFKLLHRDMGPAKRYIGPQVPSEELRVAGQRAGARGCTRRRRRGRRRSRPRSSTRV